MKSKVLAVYQFKIMLLDTDPPVWRRIQVDNYMTLRRFAAVILAVMGWNNSHLHRFEIGGKEYGIPDPDGLHDSKDFTDEKKKKLCSFSEDDLKKFTFTYDFGDGWEHDDMLRWIGGKFDPEKFTVRSTNRALLDIHSIEASFEGA